MNSKIKPVSVEAENSKKQLCVEWTDGHESVYPLFGLRKNCPCITCRGGHAKMGRFDRSLFFVEPTRRFEVEDIEQVGNHAIKIIWDDGHNTGMYQWETLRELCPCEECYPEQE